MGWRRWNWRRIRTWDGGNDTGGGGHGMKEMELEKEEGMGCGRWDWRKKRAWNGGGGNGMEKMGLEEEDMRWRR